MTDRPSTIPPGLCVELTRHRVRPGQSAKVDEWMRMLKGNDLQHLNGSVLRRHLTEPVTTVDIVFAADHYELRYVMNIK